MLGTVLKPIEIPAEVAQMIEQTIRSDQAEIEVKWREEINKLDQQLSTLQANLKSAYRDKLDGTIDKELSRTYQDDSFAEEIRVQEARNRVSRSLSKNQGPELHRTLELAQSAHSVYFALNYDKRAQLVKMVLLNCTTDGVTLYPSYRKPFDLIAERAKNEEWRSETGLNRRRRPFQGVNQQYLQLLTCRTGIQNTRKYV